MSLHHAAGGVRAGEFVARDDAVAIGVDAVEGVATAIGLLRRIARRARICTLATLRPLALLLLAAILSTALAHHRVHLVGARLHLGRGQSAIAIGVEPRKRHLHPLDHADASHRRAHRIGHVRHRLGKRGGSGGERQRSSGGGG